MMRTPFAGMSFLFSIVYLGLVVYFFMLMSRATRALESIASALESKNQEQKP